MVWSDSSIPRSRGRGPGIPGRGRRNAQPSQAITRVPAASCEIRFGGRALSCPPVSFEPAGARTARSHHASRDQWRRLISPCLVRGRLRNWEGAFEPPSNVPGLSRKGTRAARARPSSSGSSRRACSCADSESSSDFHYHPRAAPASPEADQPPKPEPTGRGPAQLRGTSENADPARPGGSRSDCPGAGPHRPVETPLTLGSVDHEIRIEGLRRDRRERLF